MKLFAALLSFAALVSGIPTGVDTCESVPQHGSWAQGCSPNACMSAGGTLFNMPFAILAVDSNNIPVTSYMPNTNYNIILSSTNLSTTYKGFLINVGRGNINGNFAAVSAAASGAGNLTVNPSDTTSRRMAQCTNGLTHVNNMNKISTTFSWLSPPMGSRSVTFKSVIVTSATSVNYVTSLRLNEMNINPSVSSTPIPMSTCNIPYTSLSGLSGATASYMISTTGSTSILGGTSPTCASGSGTSSGAKLAFMIDLGADTPLGLQLTVDTCLTAIGDTVLYVGTGCPSTSATFRCLIANDDAGSAICPSDSVASQVRFNATTRYVWAVVGNYASSTTASSGIRWWYGSASIPSVPTLTIVSTRSVMQTPTILTTVSSSPRGSRTPTMSNSITHSSTASVSMGVQPSGTSTSSPSMMPSASSSSSETSSDSSSSSYTASRSGTQSSSYSPSSMETASKSMPPSPSRTTTSSPSSTDTPIETDTPTSLPSVSSSYTSESTSTSSSSSTSSLTPSTSRNVRVLGAADISAQQTTYGMIGMGVGLGVISTIAIIGAYYVTHKNNKKMQKPLSMRNIVYLGDKGNYVSQNPMSSHDITEEVTTLSPTLYRYSKNAVESPKRETFEPVTVRNDNNI